MRFIGIDIGSEKHALTIVDEAGKILRKPTTITEDAQGYDALLAALGDPADAFVAMEATGQPQRGAICRVGNATLRQKLWMPTLCAVVHNPWLKAFYDRLLEAGKPRKVAMVAAMTKLLAAMVSVVRTRKPFEVRLAATPNEA